MATTTVADTPDTMVVEDQEAPRTKVFRCLFPTGWEESTEESSQNVNESHDEDATQEEDEDSTPEVPVPVVTAATEYSTPEEPAPAVITAAEYSTPEVPLTPAVIAAAVQRPPADERLTTIEHSAGAPDTPATPVNSSTYVPPTPVNDATSPEDHPVPQEPASASTAGSEARDVGDVSCDNDTMEHDEYKELVVAKSESRRIVRHSSRPTLWRHQRRPKASICLFDAVDDGVCLVQTGLIWSIDSSLYEVVFVSSLGWVEQRARRSHQVTFNNNPIYVIVRDAALQGQQIQFTQLHKLIAATLFRDGRAISEVNFGDITKAKGLAEDFVTKHEREYSAWVEIPYLHTRKEIQALKKEEEEKKKIMREKEQARAKRAQEKQEAMRKLQDLRELRKKEEEAKRAAAAAARKIARAESKRRSRQIAKQVKVEVLKVFQNLENNMQSELEERVDSSRAEIEADLGNRIAQVEDAVENLLVPKSSLEKVKTALAVLDKKLKSAMTAMTALDKRVKTMV